MFTEYFAYFFHFRVLTEMSSLQIPAAPAIQCSVSYVRCFAVCLHYAFFGSLYHSRHTLLSLFSIPFPTLTFPVCSVCLLYPGCSRRLLPVYVYFVRVICIRNIIHPESSFSAPPHCLPPHSSHPFLCILCFVVLPTRCACPLTAGANVKAGTRWNITQAYDIQNLIRVSA